jgi:cytochrome P450
MERVTPPPRALPGPRPMPVLGWRGNLLAFRRDPLATIIKLSQTYGTIVSLAPSQPSPVCVFGPNLNQYLLTNPQLFQPVDRLSTIFPNLSRRSAGSVGSPSLLLPEALLNVRLTTYSDHIVATTVQMIDQWQVGQLVDVAYVMDRLTKNIVAHVLFGLEVEAEVEAIDRLLMCWVNDRVASPSICFRPHISGIYSEEGAITQLQTVLRSLIVRKRASPGTAPDLLTQLAHARDQDGNLLAEWEVIDALVQLFLCLRQISATTLTWVLLLLSQHLGVLSDLSDELNGRLPGAAPTFEQLDQLRLLDCVIKESLRLLPPGSIGVRVLAAATELDGFALPAETVILYSPYITHRMPELYLAPERFRPERWIHIEPPLYTYLPFEIGPYTQLGARIAMLQMKLTLALLLQHYRLALAPGAQVDRSRSLLLTPQAGVLMVIGPPDRPVVKREVHGNIREMVIFP